MSYDKLTIVIDVEDLAAHVSGAFPEKIREAVAKFLMDSMSHGLCLHSVGEHLIEQTGLCPDDLAEEMMEERDE